MPKAEARNSHVGSVVECANRGSSRKKKLGPSMFWELKNDIFGVIEREGGKRRKPFRRNQGGGSSKTKIKMEGEGKDVQPRQINLYEGERWE